LAHPIGHLSSAQILDAFPDAVSLSDAAGKVIYLNDAWERLIGPARMEESLQVRPNVHGDVVALRPDGSAIKAGDFAITRALRGETVRDSELILTRGEGERTWLRTNAVPIRDESRGIVGAISSSHDITRLRVLEERHESQRLELQRKVNELEMIISSMADGVIITDAEGSTQLTNPAYDRMIGPEHARQTATQRFHELNFRTWEGGLLEWEESPICRALAGEQFTDGEYLVTANNGSDMYEQVSGGPLLDGHGAIVGGVFIVRDVSHLREADQEKNEFLSLVAHELRTPVTLIRGFAQLLRHSLEGRGPAESDRWLSIIDRRSDQLARLINELLDVTRLEVGHFVMHPTPIEFHELVSTVSDDMVALRPDRRVEIVGPKRIVVRGDAPRLQQVLINLIDNAITHGPPHARVTIRLEVEEATVTTYIRDEGPPLPMAHRERIFERFYQLADPQFHLHRGIGLGLYISQRIVEAHGGQLWVHDDVTSCFAFTLPLSDATASE
jgi:PAS domain S-box-containing protein